MSLSFSASDDPQSRPIAIIRDGINAGRMLWLHENPQLTGGTLPDFDNLSLVDPRSYRGFNASQINQVHKAVKTGQAPPDVFADPRLTKLYSKAQEDIDKKSGREIHLATGHFQPLPQNITDQRQVLRAGGPSGVGKSFFAAEFIKAFHEMWPERRVLLFSGKEEDKNFDHLEYMDRVDVDSLINPETGATTMPNDALRDIMCVFDDIECLTDGQKKATYELKDRLLTTGRSYNIPMILCSHINRAGKVTQIDNNETTHELLFRSGNAMHNRKLLKDYVGLDPKQAEKILSSNSRWFFIAKTAPMYCITETGAWII
jgi:hypothetical protein